MTPARRFVVATADAMRDVGAALGRVAVGRDVIVLTGELGAGKTTLTQGIAAGLGVVDNPSGGPVLVHVDAYRLGSISEVDDLDLEQDLEQGVVVVEWGEGLVEDLSSSVVHVLLTRSDDPEDERRGVVVSGADARWVDAVQALGLPEESP
jgi:tRNA threonylcarbamoyladenosine biosynthesis protein TsaE